MRSNNKALAVALVGCAVLASSAFGSAHPAAGSAHPAARSVHPAAGSAHPAARSTKPARRSAHPAASTHASQPETATASPPVLSLPAGRTVSPSDPLRVLLIGDSEMSDAEPGIAAALEATGEVQVRNMSFPGWGLTNSNDDWPTIVAQDRPDLITGMWAWDEQDAVNDPVGYATFVDSWIDGLLADGVPNIAFMQYPKSGEDPSVANPTQRALEALSYEHGREAWNSVVAEVSGQYPGQVAFLATGSSLDLHGQYATWLPVDGKWERARKLDAAHMCPAGAATLGEALVAELTPIYHLSPPAPGWQSGSWTSDPRYNDPPGACPDDQPPPGYEGGS